MGYSPARTMTIRTKAPPVTLTLTEYAVLGLLGQVGRPISGYDLKKLAATSVGYLWYPSKTQLYAVLPRLGAAGLATRDEIEQHDRPDKHVYSITDAGRAAIREWLGRSEDESDPGRSSFGLKLFFGAQGDRVLLTRQLAAFRDAYAGRLELYERRRLGEDPTDDGRVSDEFTRLSLRYGIARARAAVEWSDQALEELARS